MKDDNEEENKHLKLKKILHGVYEADQCDCRCEMS